MDGSSLFGCNHVNQSEVIPIRNIPGFPAHKYFLYTFSPASPVHRYSCLSPRLEIQIDYLQQTIQINSQSLEVSYILQKFTFFALPPGNFRVELDYSKKIIFRVCYLNFLPPIPIEFLDLSSKNLKAVAFDDVPCDGPEKPTEWK